VDALSIFGIIVRGLTALGGVSELVPAVLNAIDPHIRALENEEITLNKSAQLVKRSSTETLL